MQHSAIWAHLVVVIVRRIGDEGKADEKACMAHVRRTFVDVFASQGNAIAEETIRRITELYAVEK